MILMAVISSKTWCSWTKRWTLQNTALHGSSHQTAVTDNIHALLLFMNTQLNLFFSFHKCEGNCRFLQSWKGVCARTRIPIITLMSIVLSCSFPPFRNLNHASRTEQHHYLTWKTTHYQFQWENNSSKLFQNNCLSKLLCESISYLLKAERVKQPGKQFGPQRILALFFSNKPLLSFTSGTARQKQPVCMWTLVRKQEDFLEKPGKILTLSAINMSFSTAPLVNIIHLSDFK